MTAELAAVDVGLDPEPTTADVVVPAAVSVVEIDVGVPGPPGPAGGTYHHRQATPAAQWTVHHGLGAKPDAALFVDDRPGVPVWSDLAYPDLQTVIVTLPEPHSGDLFM